MASPVVSVPLSSAFQEAFNKIRLSNQIDGRDPEALGVHSSVPMATQKSARYWGWRHHEQEDTMARMFIQIPTGLYEKFLASLTDPETRTVANYLTGDDVSKGGIGYIDFLLQSVTHAFSEKVQVTETLCDSYVAFFFGHEPPKFSYQGVLMNTYQDDWTMRMFRIYRDLGRGTKLARNGLLLRLKYDSMIVTGAMLNLQWGLTAGQETFCPFSFDLLVKNVSILYGSLAPPTDLHMFDNNFAPEGYHVSNASGGSGKGAGGSSASTPTSSEPTKLYAGLPPASPGGVMVSKSPAPVTDYYTPGKQNDPTGTPPLVTPATVTEPEGPPSWARGDVSSPSYYFPS